MAINTRVALLLPALLLPGCGKEAEPVAEVIRPVRVARIGDPAVVDRRVPGTAKATQENNVALEVAAATAQLEEAQAYRGRIAEAAAVGARAPTRASCARTGACA